MTAVAAFILGIIFFIGGLIPAVGTGVLEQQIYEALKKPKSVHVEVISTPSFALFGGQVDRVNVVVERADLNGLYIDRMELLTSPVRIGIGGDFSLTSPNDKIILEAKVLLKEDDINDYLKSQIFLDNVKNIKEGISSSADFIKDVDINNLKFSFRNDRLGISGKIKKGGFIGVPFNLSTNIQLPSPDTLSLLNTEVSVMSVPIATTMIRQALDKANPVVDLTKLDLKGMGLHFRSIEIKDGYLLFYCAVDVKTPMNLK